MVDELTPSKAAYRLTHVLNLVSAAHGHARFPVDVIELAKEAANIFHWPDPITDVQAASIANFEGALYPDESRQKWLLLYNDRLKSSGRIRFTQAHELGHYLLHREQRAQFECTPDDMLEWTDDETNLEGQADSFAATLLMPLDDFRQQVGEATELDALSQAADRYGVSLTAAILRWLGHTPTKAVLVVHRDGFINWAWSSTSAAHAGAFFRTRNRVVEVPQGSLAANHHLPHERHGIDVPANVWFPHADADLALREMKITADQYDSTMSLLVLPRAASVWPSQTDEWT
ncbi:MAG: ImmA/IrrE family metallo-endopeptidase [Lysobacter sp.]